MPSSSPTRPEPSREPVDRLVEWYRRCGADLPWRHTRDRYAILVAETMLQATQVARVVPYYERWLERWATPAALASAPLGDVLAAWHGLGYPRRARNLHAAAGAIASAGWPDRLEDLPGVGPYTAAAIACFADERDALPVDVNVARILARRFPDGWPGTPPGRAWEVGQALMDLGREVCRARAPRCEDGCPLRAGCGAAAAGVVDAVTPRPRRQSRFTGSMRQRRGILLGEVARAGRARIADDPEAAATLVADGLVRRGRTYLLPAR